MKQRAEISKSDWAYEAAEIIWNNTDEENRINLLRSNPLKLKIKHIKEAAQYQFSELSEFERLAVINNLLVKISH